MTVPLKGAEHRNTMKIGYNRECVSVRQWNIHLVAGSNDWFVTATGGHEAPTRHPVSFAVRRDAEKALIKIRRAERKLAVPDLSPAAGV